MRSIPAEVIREIKERVDIVATVGDYVRLKRAGATYKGLCPFHQEKTPSFNVHPEKRIYHCFGCGTGGDVISFLRKIENKTFPEVIERLAAHAGVDLAPYRDEDDNAVNLPRLYEAMWNAQDLFRKNLSLSKEAQTYLKGRGFTEEVIRTFGFGFAPDSWDNLTSALKKKHFTEDELFEAGLVRRRRNSEGVYDTFRSRVVLPIHNDYGKVVAFGGRIIGEGEPKYLNSPETQIYSKGRILFNLHRAAPGTEPVEELILVEGYFDVVALHQAGYTNAIASLGTALTERHVRLLQKSTRRVIIGYDSDNAGIRATLRALQALNETDIEVLVLNIPAGKDPDDVVREEGRKGIQKAIDTALRVERYLCDSICNTEDLKSSHGKERALRRLLPLFSQLPTLVAKQNLIRMLAERLELSEEVVRRSLMQRRAREAAHQALEEPVRQRPPAPLDKRPPSGKARAERQLICCFLNDVRLFYEHKEELEVGQFSDPFCRKILQGLFERNEETMYGHVYDEFINPEAEEDDPQNRFITKEVLSNEVTPETAAQVVREALQTLKKQRLDARKKELLQLIKECSDFSQQTQYAKELNEISRTLANIQ